MTFFGIKSEGHFYSSLLAPRAGLEPATHGLTVRRSTDWSIEDYTINVQVFLYIQNYTLFLLSSCLFSSVIFRWPYPVFSGQALDLLVSVSSIRYRTSTSDLSTSSSSRGLTSFCYGISHLEGGFTLRCLQRLSRPDLATLPWSWSPTGTPAVSPSRSSRTKDSSSQISCAHAG